MKFFNKTPTFNFMRQRPATLVFSLILVVASLGSLAVNQLNFGIDFTGGVLIELGYPQPADLDAIRSELDGAGFSDGIVQNFGTQTDVMIRLPPQPTDAGDDAIAQANESARIASGILASLSGDPDVRRVEFVGPQVGEELTEAGALATMVALALIFLYVWFRFHWKFSAGAVLALAHDVIITLGVFSALQLPFDLTVLAAVLAVIGYSLNDTIVVFDRCRENFRRTSVGGPVETINRSINENLSRTLVTSLTTLLALLALYFVGGEALAGFSLALIVGVVIGTYSSIYVASPVSLALKVSREDVMEDEDNFDRSSDGAVV